MLVKQQISYLAVLPFCLVNAIKSFLAGKSVNKTDQTSNKAATPFSVTLDSVGKMFCLHHSHEGNTVSDISASLVRS